MREDASPLATEIGSLRDLDLGTLATLAGNALSEKVRTQLREKGHGTLRISHGFVFQHLMSGDRTVGELASRMAITQQAVSKTVTELESLGYLERAFDPADARIRRVVLTKRGRDAIAKAREARAGQEEALEKQLGKKRIASARATLAAVLELLGESDAIRGRRVRAPT